MKVISELGIQIPQVYLPKPGTDLTKWAVIACDQFTSQEQYWKDVQKLVGSAPSTLNMIFPEIYLEQSGEAERIRNIQACMKQYLSAGILQAHEGLIYVERTVSGKTRKGLMLCLDLEHYDYTKGSGSLIRATEGTIVERLPPRIKVRQGAELELPHILVLIDDPQMTVIEPLSAATGKFEKLYDFDLMFDSGHLTGFAVNDEYEQKVISALHNMARPELFAAKYGVGKERPILLFAMGDGNHSLATAKAIWEQAKAKVGMDHPSRYALVEIENVHDHGLEFEPIHRLLFGLNKDLLAALQSAFGGKLSYVPSKNLQEMISAVDSAPEGAQAIGLVRGGASPSFGVIEIRNPSFNLAVGSLQPFLDEFIKNGGANKIDYVHGADVLAQLGAQAGNAGFYLAGMHKSELFKTVIVDGVLPCKTFSMGEAHEKRFYMEARKIS